MRFRTDDMAWHDRGYAEALAQDVDSLYDRLLPRKRDILLLLYRLTLLLCGGPEPEFMEVELDGGGKALVLRAELKRITVAGSGKVWLMLEGQNPLQLAESEWQRLREELS